MDSFHCPHGTIFNEYLGTCDHSDAAYCSGKAGKGFAPPKAKPHYEAPGYHKPEPYHEPHYKSYEPGYHKPEPYHPEPEVYHPPAPAYGRHEPAYHPEPGN